MCGIAGLVATAPRDDARAVRDMLESQVHRGPEGISVASAGRATFGVCQLRFVGTDAPPQPFRSAGDDLLVAFNGEIYNWRELFTWARDRGGGPTFRSEAELLADLFLIEGTEMFGRLNGMFAIAVHDRRTGTTYLARDRLGKKPLAYVAGPDGLAFSSELSALSGYAKGIDARAVTRYLTFNAVPAPLSMLAGVHKAEPGTVLAVRDGTVRRRERYWSLRIDRGGHADAERLEHLLERAVRSRAGYSPTGILLSGGLDSSLVAALARRAGSAELFSYSVGFPENRTFDETDAARTAAAHLGIEHTVLALDPRTLAEAIRRELPAIDEPVADHSLIPTLLVARTARRRVKVVLTGDGADELAMGYQVFAVSQALRVLRRAVPPVVLRPLLRSLSAGGGNDRNLALSNAGGLIARMIDLPPERQYYGAAAAVPPSAMPGLLTREALAEAADDDAFQTVTEVVRHGGTTDPAERLQLGLICHFLRDVILSKLDRASMAASVEARSPFLDNEVMDFLLAVPRQAKFARFTGKRIIREIAARHLPATLMSRPKRGFRVPVSALLRGPLRDWLHETLDPVEVKRRGLFDATAVERLVVEHTAAVADHHRALWSLVCLHQWIFSTESRIGHQLTV